jgi:transposase
MTSLMIGVDIAKNTFTVGYYWDKQTSYVGEFANQLAGFEQLAQKVKTLQKQTQAEHIHLIVEPTGGYEGWVVRCAYEWGWLVSLPNPKNVRRWAEGRGKRSKTDRQDACVLAMYGGEQNPPPQQPVPEDIAELDDLLRRRDDLEKLLRAEENRHKIFAQRPRSSVSVLESLQRVIDRLQKEIEEINQVIANLFNSYPHLQEEADLLRTVPGIGLKNRLPLLVLYYRFLALTGEAASPKALTAFLGLDPRHRASGTSVHARSLISKMGDSNGRRLLYLGALGGVRGNSPLRTFYQRLVGRGKAKRLALVAASRKILLWGWAVFSQKSPFDSSRFEPISA